MKKDGGGGRGQRSWVIFMACFERSVCVCSADEVEGGGVQYRKRETGTNWTKLRTWDRDCSWLWLRLREGTFVGFARATGVLLMMS